MMSTSSPNETSSGVKVMEASQEVPIFLRKTFHMIDTCDPEVASWSEDGETFVVKDPIRFETTIIPQFFKHSKFSSFVRQLNFYSFRKLKNADTLRIDPKLEAETANYWRFKHEHFRRGRPDLLTEIKRMNHANKAAAVAVTGAVTSAVTPDVIASTLKTTPLPSLVVSDVAHTQVKSEVQELKKKIEEMTKTMDELSAMVHQVSLKQNEQDVALQESQYPLTEVGPKRKKMLISPDVMTPTRNDDMDLDQVLEVPIDISSEPLPPLDLNDDDNEDLNFVDEFFMLQDDNFLVDGSLTSSPSIEQEHSKGSPDPELMKRLSHALALLPREVQEMIVERLITAIVSSSMDGSDDSVFTRIPNASDSVPNSPRNKAVTSVRVPETTEEALSLPASAPTTPLATATLAALLHHYSARLQGLNQNPHKNHLPLIPVHG